MIIIGQALTDPNWAEKAQVWISSGAILAALIVAGIYYRQLRVMQAGRDRDSILALNDLLQKEQSRADRETLFNLHADGRDGPNNNEYREAADCVGTTLQSVGYLVRKGKVKKNLVIGNWGHNIKQMFTLVQPWMKYRETKERLPVKVWPDFRWLAEKAGWTPDFVVTPRPRMHEDG